MTSGPGNRETVANTLTHWKEDPDLAGIRDADTLAKLPEDEREAWRKLWGDVDALLARATRPAADSTGPAGNRELPAEPFAR